tara:strand:+ start:1381 stop:1599 length:219 start_codon:yes stop_codon:yes gene_type:complete
MADEVMEEVKTLRAVIKSTEPKFVTYSASERTSLLYNRNTGIINAIEMTVNSDSLQTFKVGENKVKLLFKVE